MRRRVAFTVAMSAVLLAALFTTVTAASASAQTSQADCPSGTEFDPIEQICKQIVDAVSPSPKPEPTESPPVDDRPNTPSDSSESGEGGGGSGSGGGADSVQHVWSAPAAGTSSGDAPGSSAGLTRALGGSDPGSNWAMLFRNELDPGGSGGSIGVPTALIDAGRVPFASSVLALLRSWLLLPLVMLLIVWARYAMVQRHRPDLLPIGKALAALRPALAGQGAALARLFGLAVVVVGLELLRPWPIKVIVDRVLRPAQASGLFGLDVSATVVFAAAATLVISVALGTVSVRLVVAGARIGKTATVRIRRTVFEHLHRLALPFHESSRTGDLLFRVMGDVNNLRDVLFSTWINLLARALLFLGAAIALLVVSPWLALVALLPLPLLGLELLRLSRNLRQVVGDQFTREGRAASYAGETLRNIGLVKAYAAEDRSTEHFATESQRGEEAGAMAANVSARMGLVTQILIGAGLAAVLFVGALQVLSGNLSPGTLIVVVAYARALYKPVRKASSEGKRLSKAMASAGRLIEILSVEPEDFGSGRRAPQFRGDISLRGVRFAYPDGVTALKGISIEIPAAALVFIRGPNGSGKSTLLSLLLRLLKPDKGEVLIDGEPVESFELESYRRRFAYVPQNTQLFRATVRENIMYGRPEATDQEVEDAARVTLLDEVVAGLPNGYETVLGEDGATLSGGEARRLMLARAAVRDARVVLLDEPLAGVDAESRETVAEAIRRFTSGRTTIVVSHGSASELEPDAVVQLLNGKIDHVEWISTAFEGIGGPTDTITQASS
jgi:ATP-binding cassette subfamily B protein